MRFPSLAVALVMVTLACASAPAGGPGDQSAIQQPVLSRGESVRLVGTDLLLQFEEVIADSRCPLGTECVWEGDAAVRISITAPGQPASVYTIHSSERFGRDVVHGPLRVRFVSLAPHPSAGKATTPDEYRLSLTVHRL